MTVRGAVVVVVAVAVVAAGCGRGAARTPAGPMPLPVPARFAALFAGDRVLVFDASHGETPMDGESNEFETTVARLRCAQEVAVVGEFHVARITCEVEARPPDGDADGHGDGVGDEDGDGVGDEDGDGARDGDGLGDSDWVVDDTPSLPIESDVEGRYVTDGVGLWRDERTDPWPPPLADLRALVQTPALIAGVQVPGRDDHPTEAEEARGYYHEVRRDDHDGLCGADVSTGGDTSVQSWCIDGAHGLYLVNRGFDGGYSREDQATLRDD